MPKKRMHEESRGDRALLITQQIDFAIELLIEFKRRPEVSRLLSERWGMSRRTADSRVSQASKQIAKQVNAVDRQEVVACMMEQCLAIAKTATETKQLSNSIGALRLYGELVGLTGNNRR